MTATGKLDAVGEEQILEGGTGIGLEEFAEGQQFDLEWAPGFHGRS